MEMSDIMARRRLGWPRSRGPTHRYVAQVSANAIQARGVGTCFDLGTIRVDTLPDSLKGL